jgi:hypothetical protein
MWWRTRAHAVRLDDLIVPAAVASAVLGCVLIVALRIAPLYMAAVPATVTYVAVLYALSGSGVRSQVTLVVHAALPRAGGEPSHELPKAA